LSALFRPFFICLTKGIIGRSVEKYDINFLQNGIFFHFFQEEGEHDLGALVEGESRDAGADGGEGDGGEAVFFREFEAGPDASGEGVGGGDASKTQAGGMEDISGGQPACGGNGCVADPDGADPVAFFLNSGSAFAGDGPGQAAAEDQIIIGGIDDGVDGAGGDVALFDENPVHVYPLV